MLTVRKSKVWGWDEQRLPPLFIFWGKSGDNVMTVRFAIVAFCSWKPYFQILLEHELVHKTADIPPFPFHVVCSTEEFVDVKDLGG